jgi:hypothetical protein
VLLEAHLDSSARPTRTRCSPARSGRG